MKPILIALLLVILILDDHAFHAKSASFESPLGDIYFGRGRMLRKLPKPPPAPKLSQSPHYKFLDPPPPSPPPPSLPIRATYPSFRTLRKFSPPPAPKLSKPRNFRMFPSAPPSPPPPPSLPPLKPPAPVKKPPTNCDLPTPPPGHN
ncbi:hypothetical protein Tco_0355107 [Tanacetum coccineum]